MKYNLEKKKTKSLKTFLLFGLLIIGVFMAFKTCVKTKALNPNSNGLTIGTYNYDLNIDLSDMTPLNNNNYIFIKFYIPQDMGTSYLYQAGNNTIYFTAGKMVYNAQTPRDLYLNNGFYEVIMFFAKNYDLVNTNIYDLYVDDLYLTLENCPSTFLTTAYFNLDIRYSPIANGTLQPIGNFDNLPVWTSWNGVLYSASHSNGYIAGETAGYNSGYSAGETAGYNSGYSAGETAGYNSGYSAGETAGYNSGYSAGEYQGLKEKQSDIFDNTLSNLNPNINYTKEIINQSVYYQFLIPLNDFIDREQPYEFLKCSYYNVTGTSESFTNIKQFINLFNYSPNGVIAMIGSVSNATINLNSADYSNKYLYVNYYLDINTIKCFYFITSNSNFMIESASVPVDNIYTIPDVAIFPASKRLLTITNDYPCYISKKSNYYFDDVVSLVFRSGSGPLGGNSSITNAYTQGYNAGLSETIESSGVSNFFVGIFTALSAFFGLQIFPGITIGMIIFIPLAIGLCWFILKLARGGGD